MGIIDDVKTVFLGTLKHRRISEMGGVEKATDDKERNGNLLYTDFVLRRQGSRESCDNRATGAFAVRQYECKALVLIGECFMPEGPSRADKI